MTKSKTKTLSEKEAQLLDKIERARATLSRLREKRAIECGRLAVKHNLHLMDDLILAKCFKQLAQELSHEQ